MGGFCETQCGNFMIFVSSRFYVKSILRILEVQNQPFYHIQRLWILTFMNFCTFWRLKCTKWTKFAAPKVAKMAVFALLKSTNSISRKISEIQKSWSFHTVHCALWKNEKFSITKKLFCEINSLVIYFVKLLLSRNFCHKSVRENFHNFHTVESKVFNLA